MEMIIKRLEPQAIADTSTMPRQEWLELRKLGIGGSDAAAVLGGSPFRTARDIYYEKVGIEVEDSDNSNWVQLEYGNLLEDLSARIFHEKTGLKIHPAKKMYRHPIHKFMLANPDYFTQDRDGPAVLEIKTTNYFAKDNWFHEGEEIVPMYYEAQVRHYMAVLDLNRAYICCLYGNTINDVIIRKIDRDMDYEQELIHHEKYFVDNYWVKNVPPPYTESGDLVLQSVKRRHGGADISAPKIALDVGYSSDLELYLALQSEKMEWGRGSKEVENRLNQVKARILDRMGKSCSAACVDGDMTYEISYKPSLRPTIDKDGLLRLKTQYPEIYDEFVNMTETRRFSVKSVAVDGKSSLTEAMAA
jgi:putative phage-type endonuclease